MWYYHVSESIWMDSRVLFSKSIVYLVSQIGKHCLRAVAQGQDVCVWTTGFFGQPVTSPNQLGAKTLSPDLSADTDMAGKVDFVSIQLLERVLLTVR